MSVKLRDLIRSVRTCKTAAEERAVVAKECAAIRNAFKENDADIRHRNVAKLLFFHMLGYPTHFGQMECLKLISSTGYPDKRIGYLGLTLLLDERQEVLMLVTNSLKNDLHSKNQYITGLALVALGNIGSTEMCRDLAPEVERLLSSSSTYVRKKATLCTIRIIKKVPDMVDIFVQSSLGLLKDRHHGVLVACMQLLLTMCNITPSLIPSFREKVPDLVRILKSLVLSGFTPDHDISGVTDPFLQVKALRLLRCLAAGDAASSDQMSDILAQVATSVESGMKNAGNAILYEAVRTIMGVESLGGLRVLAINILGRFLANRDNNIRYVALSMLSQVVAVDTQAVQRHRGIIVDCVKDSDVSIRRRALDLVYALVNASNITTLTKELLEYLAVSDVEFKGDLTSKIVSLVERFAPSKRWHIDTIVQVFKQGGRYVREEQGRAFLALLSNTPELHAYATRALYSAVFEKKNQFDHHTLMMVGVWCIGEYGDLLVKGADYHEDEATLSVSANELLSLLESLLRDAGSGTVMIREMILTCLVKLSSRLEGVNARLEELIQSHQGSMNLELQQRACEYGRLFVHQNIRSGLLDHMPPVDASLLVGSGVESEEVSSAGEGSGGGAPSGAGGERSGGGGAQVELKAPCAPAQPPPSTPAQDLMGDLLNMDLLEEPSASSSACAPSAGNDLLVDLLGGPPSSAAPPVPSSSDPASTAPTPLAAAAAAAAVAANPGDALMDLLGGVEAQGGASISLPTPDPLQSILGAYPEQASPGFGALTASPPVPTPPVSSPGVFPAFCAFQKGPLSINFHCSKPQPGNPSLTLIAAEYINSGGSPLMDFTLQAAVPKVMQIQLAPASGTVVGPYNARVTQNVQVVNSMHGQKSLVLKLKISYKADGVSIVEEATVNQFPVGL